MESVYFDGTGYQSDDDFAALKTSGLERLAQEFFDCVGSFMPVFYRG